SAGVAVDNSPAAAIEDVPNNATPTTSVWMVNDFMMHLLFSFSALVAGWFWLLLSVDEQPRCQDGNRAEGQHRTLIWCRCSAVGSVSVSAGVRPTAGNLSYQNG